MGRLIFYESVGLKLQNTMVVLILLILVGYALSKSDVAYWLSSWQFQSAGLAAFLACVYIWHKGSVVFDEMMQVVIINRWYRKLLKPKMVYYSEIREVLLKRHIHKDSDGHTIVEGYFHLRLLNGVNYLLFVFKGADCIFEANKKLKSHTKLPVRV